jgi:integrase
MNITALDTGTRHGEMLALRFADIDEKRQLIASAARRRRARRLGWFRSRRCG